jgi:hypothetical protein
MNPGKSASDEPEPEGERLGAGLPATGWEYDTRTLTR